MRRRRSKHPSRGHASGKWIPLDKRKPGLSTRARGMKRGRPGNQKRRARQ